MKLFFILPIIFLLSFVSTYLYRRIVLSISYLDTPKDHSAHDVPLPTAGGVGFVFAFLAALYFFHRYGLVDHQLFLALGIGGALVAAVSFIDDLLHVPMRWQLLVQCVATLMCIYLLLTPFVFTPLIALFSLFGFLSFLCLQNRYHFKDGFDGLAVAEVLFVSIAIIFMVTLQGSGADQSLLWSCLLIVFSVLGFLLWNLPSKKIFMGNTGRVFLGFVMGTLGLFTFIKGAVPIWCWIILLSVIWVDATVTFIRQLIRGEGFYLAHKRDAHYQAEPLLGTHRQILKHVFLINLFWLFPWAMVVWYLVPHEPFTVTWTGFVITIIALVPIFVFATRLKRQTP